MFITDSVQHVSWTEMDSQRVTRAHRATRVGGVSGALWATREIPQGPGTTVLSVGIVCIAHQATRAGGVRSAVGYKGDPTRPGDYCTQCRY